MAINAKKLTYWQQHFKRCQASGLTRHAYCAREALALSTFDRWRNDAGVYQSSIHPTPARPLLRALSFLSFIDIYCCPKTAVTSSWSMLPHFGWQSRLDLVPLLVSSAMTLLACVSEDHARVERGACIADMRNKVGDL